MVSRQQEFLPVQDWRIYRILVCASRDSTAAEFDNARPPKRREAYFEEVWIPEKRNRLASLIDLRDIEVPLWLQLCDVDRRSNSRLP